LDRCFEDADCFLKSLLARRVAGLAVSVVDDGHVLPVLSEVAQAHGAIEAGEGKQAVFGTLADGKVVDVGNDVFSHALDAVQSAEGTADAFVVACKLRAAVFEVFQARVGGHCSGFAGSDGDVGDHRAQGTRGIVIFHAYG